MFTRLLLAAIAACALVDPALAQPKDNYTRTEDVVYGRKFGTALTLDVFTPKENANGKGVIWIVSGGWFSAKPAGIGRAKEFVDRGYVVFAVTHGSQPKFTIPEVLEDMHRATRFVRANAKKYSVDPEKLGIYGESAGGHLSLMQGNAPKPGNPKSTDPVERETSKVAAVACFYPPTDFLNYGKEGETALGEGTLAGFKAPFDFRELNKEPRPYYVSITDPARRREIAKEISPAYHVTKDSAPALVVHGDADKLVPIQQAELIGAKYKEAGVPFELVVKKGEAHGWKGQEKDMKALGDWFDKYLLEKK